MAYKIVNTYVSQNCTTIEEYIIDVLEDLHHDIDNAWCKYPDEGPGVYSYNVSLNDGKTFEYRILAVQASYDAYLISILEE